MSDIEFDSKEQFLEAVREDGAVVNDVEYFTTGDGSSTSYKARTDDGEVEDVTKSDVENAWTAVQSEMEEDEQESNQQEQGSERDHLGTLYYSQSNWSDDHLQQLEEALDELDWAITGKVESGGYRIGGPN